MLSKILTALTALTAAAAMADQPELPCEAPPQGSSQQVKDCYAKACAEWRANRAECDAGDQFCIDLQNAIYHNALAQCNLERSMETSADLVVYRTDDGWAVAWPGEEFPSSATTRLAFNM
jgi:hypothetical protein